MKKTLKISKSENKYHYFLKLYCNYSNNILEFNISILKELDMEEFFVIKRRKLDKSWNLSDLHEANNAFDYCEQMLDIPEEYIVDAEMGAAGLEITIIDADEDEDWYMQLQRAA